MSNETAFQTAALEIADHLSGTAYRSDGRVTWCGTTHSEKSNWTSWDFTYRTLGPDLYGGTAGIALFLAESYRQSRDEVHKATAIGAINHALDRARTMPDSSRYALYSGRLGIAYAAVRAGCLLEREDLVRRGRRILGALTRLRRAPVLLDVVSGAASGIPVLLWLSRYLRMDPAEAVALKLARNSIRVATRRSFGWCWGKRATGFDSYRPLTGFAHGTAGFAWALLETYGRTGSRPFLRAARAAFRYEDHFFDSTIDNWPDFRQNPFKRRPVEASTAWCHGAPGIGLSRVRAMQLDSPQLHRTAVRAAMRSSQKHLDQAAQFPDQDFSLCHGLAGILEFVFTASTRLRNRQAFSSAQAMALERAATYAGRPDKWPSGVSGHPNPSLMIGLAGVGYFYLRASDPSIPSLLLPTFSELSVQAGAITA